MSDLTTAPRKLTKRDYRLANELVSQGWRMLDLARMLDMSESSLYRYIDNDDLLRAAIEEGRGREHHALINSLFVIATDTSTPTPATKAAVFLLRSRHGYRENAAETDGPPQVAISITMPAALSPAQYEKLSATHPPGTIIEALPQGEEQ